MSQTLFGTDGIRGRFGEAPLDRATVQRAVGAWARRLEASAPLPTVVLGGDTRESTPAVLDWVREALSAHGVDSRLAGTIPTPGVAWLVRELGANGGLMVSASHNAHHDNGIKLIDRDGFKLTAAAEAEIEREAQSSGDTEPPGGLGDSASEVEDGLAERYLESLLSSVFEAGLTVDREGDLPLSFLKIAVDPGNGAASAFARPLLERLGAQVFAICDQPDGRNINAQCGATAPEKLIAAVLKNDCDFGLGFDGDADRVVLVDEHGAVRDGDAILFLWAQDLRVRGKLEPPAIVATAMSNLGLERALAPLGIKVVRCDVGDRNVVATLLERGLILGGEASGHIVNLQLSTTGDGLLTGVQLAAMRARTRPFSELLAPFQRLPQVVRNVAVREKRPFAEIPALQSAIAAIEQRLGDQGRLLLRYSGTEGLARVMVEGPDQSTVDAMTKELAEVLRAELGGD